MGKSGRRKKGLRRRTRESSESAIQRVFSELICILDLMADFSARPQVFAREVSCELGGCGAGAGIHPIQSGGGE